MALDAATTWVAVFTSSCGDAGPETEAPPVEVANVRQAATATVTLFASADATIYNEDGTAAGDRTTELMAGYGGPKPNGKKTHRALVKFDVSSIPGGSTVNSVDFHVHVNEVPDPSKGAPSPPVSAGFSLFTVNGAWSEGAPLSSSDPDNPHHGITMRPGAPTWTARVWAATNPALWSAAGGGWVSTQTASATFTVADLGDYTASSSATGNAKLVQDVQGWLNTPSSNTGWLLKVNNETVNWTMRGFTGRDAPPGTTQPEPATKGPSIVVGYTLPLCYGVVCPAPTQCQTSSTCDSATGQCKTTNKVDGTACSLGTLPQCHVATCQSGTCTSTLVASGTKCDDSNACTQGDSCAADGTCSGSPVQCTSASDCQINPGTCQSDGSCKYDPKGPGSSCAGNGTCDASGQCNADAAPPNVFSWGYNTYGEVAGGTLNAANGSPSTGSPSFPSPSGVVQASSNMFFSIALDSDANVWTSGSNANGLLGDKTFTISSRNGFAKVSGLSGLTTAVAAGGSHGLALLSNGTVYAWGANNYGQMGSAGGGTLGADPRAVTGLFNVIAIAAGQNHSVALTTLGEVWSWGNGTSGELGDGGTARNSTAPVKASLPVRARAIAAGQFFTIALGMNGTVYAWGDPSNNELGTPGTTIVSAPITVAVGSSIRAIAAGGQHALALGADGTVYAWGSNANGELGFGSTSAYSGPGHVTTAPSVYLTNVVGIAAGKDHSAALKDDGTVWTWGSNTDGQLGDPTRATPATRANQSVPGLTDVRSITAGYKTVLAVKAFRKAFTWGTNQFGDLGTSESPTARPFNPVPVITAKPTGFPATVKAVSASCGHKLLLGGDGTVWGWGDNQNGQLTSAVAGTSTSTPTRINITGVADVAAGCQFSAALKSDGTVWVWGYGGYGAIGDGLFKTTSTPTRVLGTPGGGPLTSVISISAKGGNVVAVESSGYYSVWGENIYREAANTTDSGIGTPYTYGYSTRAVAGGLYSNYALLDDGTVIGWGKNSDCDLGAGFCGANQGTQQFVRAASGSGNLTGVTSLAAGYRFAGAIAGGVRYVWGYNVDGELGQATPTQAAVPIAVATPIPFWVQMDGGWNVLYSRSSTGQIVSAGSGTNGGLGNGQTSSSNGWVLVSDIRSVSMMAAGKQGGIAVVP